MCPARVGLFVALVATAGLVACAQGGPSEPLTGVEAETSEAPATPAPTQGLPAVAPADDAGGTPRDAGGSPRDASGSSSGASGSSSGASGSSSGSSSGATPGGDCPSGDLTYYYKAVQELAGPTPKDCPCTGATCCYGGLVCVPL